MHSQNGSSPEKRKNNNSQPNPLTPELRIHDPASSPAQGEAKENNSPKQQPQTTHIKIEISINS